MSTRQSNADWQPGDSKTSRSLLGAEQALIWRDGKVMLVPSRETAQSERDFGVADLEGMCQQVAERFGITTGSFFSDGEKEDLLMSLVSSTWLEAARLYDPNKGASLFTFAYGRVRPRCIDWMRKTLKDERQFARDMRKRGATKEEIKHAVRHFRRSPSLNVESRDTDAALAADDPDLVALFEEGERARQEIEALVTNGEVVYEVGSLAAAERALSINADLLTSEARHTLVSIALPIANGESLEQIGEDNSITRRGIELAMAALREELELQA